MNQQANYRTLGYFYRNEAGYNCRKYLDIKEEGYSGSCPEIVLLMLSPGSCGEHEDVELEQEIEVKPDAALLRVQHFMARTALSWVRVLNLSDIEQKSSEMFFKRLDMIDADSPAHSIFHPSRVDELGEHAKVETPFLLAWGHDPRTKKLANTAVANIREKGYSIINEEGPHYHPQVKSTGGIPVWVDYADAKYRAFRAAMNQLPEGGNPSPSSDKDSAKQMLSLDEKIRSAFKFFNRFDFGDPIITAAKEEGRWSLFATLLRESGLRPFVGTEDYDYVFTDHIADAAALYDLLQKHNGRKIIIDAAASPEILFMEGGIELLGGAMCLCPDSGAKWKVGQDCSTGEKPSFTFNGKIVLLVSQSKEALKGDKRFEALLRDCIVI